MKNFYKIIFLFLILSSNTLASITYKQSSSSLNSVTTALRGINFNPDDVENDDPPIIVNN